MAIGIISKNIVSTVLIPIIYWVTGSLFCAGLNLYKFAPWSIYYFSSEKLYSFKTRFMHTVLILVISTIVIFYESKKEDF